MKSHGNWRKRSKELGIGVGIVLMAGLWLAIVAATWADAAEPGSISRDAGGWSAGDASQAISRSPASENDASSGDEYSFSWLDPDKKIYVLQNRKYHKAKHLLLSLMGGPGISNPYRTTWNIEPRIAYYFSEAFGVEGFYTASTNSNNATFDALETQATNTRPVIREIHSQYGLLAHWAPWYAKINVFNSILYFDWYFEGGAGQVGSVLYTYPKTNAAPTTANDNLFALYFGTGHQYYISQSFIVRLDFMGAFYHAFDAGISGDKSWFSNYNFGIGFGLRI